MRIAVTAAKVTLALLCVAVPGKAQTTETGLRPVLVELFTSEGCSSCPPADALLRQLNGAHVPPNALIIALSEHVTYWNSLGWADPFSQELFTARQNGYGERFRLDSVYTPQVVVNGERQVLGSDGRAILRAISSLGQGSAGSLPVTLHIISANAAGQSLVVTYTLEGEAAAAELYAVIADDMDTSTVPRGENSGRTLTHVAVARSLQRMGKVAAEGRTQSITLALPAEVKGRALPARHLVLFAQAPGLGKVLSVDMKPL